MNIPSGYNQIVPKKCPVCGTQRKRLSFEPVNNSKTRTAIYVTCDECKTAIVFFVSQNEVGMMTVGMLTDLSRVEVEKFFRSKPISEDEVIDVYENLNK